MLALLLLLIQVLISAPAYKTAPSLGNSPGEISGIAADTVRAGELFVTNLPDSINGMRSVRYTGIVLPTRSWLLNQTFFWRTSEADRGDHALWFYVFRESEIDMPADSLAIHVTIR